MKRAPPCLACRRRAWRPLGGFLVLGCAARGLRFGIAADIRRGHVNRAGGCVAMPSACAGFEGGQTQGEGRQA